MTLDDLTRNHISNGLFLEINYEFNNEKYYSLILNSNIINDFNLYDEKIKPNIIFDVLLNEEFSFENKNIYMIKYIGIPINYKMNTDVNDNKEYLDSLSLIFLDKKIKFEHFLSRFFDKKERPIKHEIILASYPNHNRILKSNDDIKKLIIQKYIKIDDESVKDGTDDIINATDVNLLNTLNFLLVDIKNENVIDPVFIKALRKKWLIIINKHKKEIIKKLNDKNILNDMNESEREEYLSELELFKIELKKDESKELAKLNSLKEIISYYPSILYPIPYFVYNEY